MFKRVRNNKKGKVSSRHLFVQFGGPGCGVLQEHLEAALSGCPIELYHVSRDSSPDCFLSFENPQVAAAAKEQLHGALLAENTLGRKLEIRHARKTDEQPLVPLDRSPTFANVSSVLDVASFPQGLRVIENFISEEDEARLMQVIDGGEWETTIRRRTQHFGFEFDYEMRNVNSSFSGRKAFPPAIQTVADLVSEVTPHPPDQLTINEYVPGMGISSHVDTHSAFEDGISSLSLLASVVFEMRRAGQRFQFVLPRRSLLVMTGESRYVWAHYIPHRSTDLIDNEVVPRERRVSLTFRTVSKSQVCSCDFPLQCDSVSSEPLLDHTQNELLYVNEFYNRIADHFSETRHHAWPLVEHYVNAIERGRLLLDVGCGNGRHLLCAPEGVNAMGCDITQRFVEISRDRGLQAIRCDGLNLPYRSCLYDYTICIAVIHHLETEPNRIRLLQELCRVTTFNGEVMVTAWAFEQDEKSKRVFEEQDVMVPWQLPQRFDAKATEQKVTAIQRYCHVFKQGELEALIEEHLPNALVLDVSYERSNWCVTFKKTSLG